MEIATYPLNKGPSIGPMKGANVYSAVGLLGYTWHNHHQSTQHIKVAACTHIEVFCGAKMSPTVPPATLRNAELKNPVKNLKIRYTAAQERDKIQAAVSGSPSHVTCKSHRCAGRRQQAKNR